MSDIRKKAMIVKLRMSRWGATKTDVILGQRVAKSQDAKIGTVKTIKLLMPEFNSAFHRLNNICRFARKEHNIMTFPGLSKGESILSGKMFIRYTTVLTGLQSEFYSAVNTFRDTYPEIKRMAPERMGKMYKETDFPAVNEIANYYTFDIDRIPMPTTDDWRMDDVSEEKLEEMKVDVEEQLRIVYNNCHMEVYSRMAEILGRLSDQAKSYKGGHAPGGGLRQALFDDLAEISNVLPLLNMEDDPVINMIASRIKTDILPVEPEDIRKNSDLRDQIAKLTDDLLEKVKK